MPINEAYQFMNADAALDDKNQFLDFLRRDAMQKGMGTNYQAGLGNIQEQMNVLGAQTQRPDVAANINRGRPAPQVNRPATRPVAPVQPMAPFQYEPTESIETNEPYIPEQRTTQTGMEGIGSWDSLPIGEPQGTKILPPNAMAPMREDEPEQPSAPAIPESFDGTTVAKKAQEMGMDPRQLFVALAELSAGLGNVKGQPQQSTARGFYEMQKKYEQQGRDNTMRAMRLDAPKQADPLDATRMELLKAQTDLTRNRAQTEAELSDPTSPRSQALRSALEVYMQKSMGIPQWKAKPEMTGTDVYKWLSPLNFAIGQQAAGERSTLQQQSQERMLQDRLDAQAQMQGARGQQQRELLETRGQQQATNLAARTAGRIDAQKPSGAYGEQIQVPGWRKTQNVPVEKTELKQFRDRSSKVPRVIEKINQLKGMIQKYGAFENPYNEAGTLMRQLSNDIKLDLKGPEFKALGVLAGPDMSILEALIPDTSSPQNALRGDASVARSLDMLTQNLRADLDAAARQLGFEKDAEQSTQPTTTGTRGLPVWKP